MDTVVVDHELAREYFAYYTMVPCLGPWGIVEVEVPVVELDIRGVDRIWQL